jgi:hypothetical protein
MDTFINFCKTNPVRAMAILNAAIVVATSFGLHLTTQQIVAIGGLGSIILGVGGELVRSQVTPTATLPDHVAAAVNAAQDANVPKRAVVAPPDVVIPIPPTPPVVAPPAAALPATPKIISVTLKGLSAKGLS